ncbi:MAG: PTS system fructose-specific EIIABC component [Candidatus Anoxychlamydiales bacterium]|nr:PTS system fructose-specific EIIABC component [Candidatus Anoxychlamydiales bacterium]
MAILAKIKKATIGELFKFKKKNISRISDLLDETSICFLKSKNRNEAISEMIDALDKKNVFKDKNKFYQAIIEREKIISTGIGMGVAIPHAKLDDLDDFFIAIGILKQTGIDWKSIDKNPVRIIFMIGGPESKQNEYLQLLSKLTIAIREVDLRKNILRLKAKEDILKLFSQF